MWSGQGQCKVKFWKQLSELTLQHKINNAKGKKWFGSTPLPYWFTS